MIEGIGDRASFAGFARARRRRCGPVGVRFVARTGAPATPEGPVRVAYAINRKVGTAVVRNRIRRRLREALAALDREDPGSLPVGDYLFTADASAARLPFAELKDAVRCATRRVSVGG